MLQERPPKKRKQFQTDYIHYLRKKNEKVCAQKQQQLELDRKQFELARQECKARMEHEAKMMELVLKLTNNEH